MEEFQFPIERSSAMKLLGQFWTGIIPGQILIGALIFISLLFMGNQQFNLISIIIFFLIFLPFIIVIHQRFVNKGRRLMVSSCSIRFDTDEMKFEFTSGFPNTMKPELQEVIIQDKNRDVTIKGDSVGGYHLRLGNVKDIRAIRLGLWFDKEDAVNGANKLVNLTNGQLYDESNESEKDDSSN